jgi:hypothetical protein
MQVPDDDEIVQARQALVEKGRLTIARLRGSHRASDHLEAGRLPNEESGKVAKSRDDID